MVKVAWLLRAAMSMLCLRMQTCMVFPVPSFGLQCLPAAAFLHCIPCEKRCSCQGSLRLCQGVSCIPGYFVAWMCLAKGQSSEGLDFNLTSVECQYLLVGLTGLSVDASGC